MKRLAALALCCVVGAAQHSAPYKDGREQRSTFEGPGRDLPEPQDVREVRIGYYGPADESHADGGMLWQGATLAIEEANREGGYHGKPFALASRWSENPWRAGAAEVTRLVYVDQVWAVIGSIEGAGTHLAEQVVVKALLTLVNPVATDRSIHMAGVPWMFSVVQGDDLHAALLAARLRGREVTLLSAIDHDSRAFVSELKAAFAREHVTIRSQVEFEPGDAEMGARRAAGTKPGMLVVIADARASAQAVRAAREAGYTGPIAGGPWFGRAAFAEQAGSAAEGAIFSWTGAPSNEFVRKFAARFDRDPDYAAAGAYDSVRIVVAAIRKAGLNRARIRDAIAQLGRYEGASGWIEWDEFGQNRRPPMLGRIVQGRATPLD